MILKVFPKLYTCVSKHECARNRISAWIFSSPVRAKSFGQSLARRQWANVDLRSGHGGRAGRSFLPVKRKQTPNGSSRQRERSTGRRAVAAMPSKNAACTDEERACRSWDEDLDAGAYSGPTETVLHGGRQMSAFRFRCSSAVAVFHPTADRFSWNLFAVIF